MVVTIDGREYEDPGGGTVLDVLRRHGIDVPTLCHDPRLAPSGGCRLCLVDIERFTHPMSACTTAIQANDVITTMSPGLTAERRAELTLLARHFPVDGGGGDTVFHRYLMAYQVEPAGIPRDDERPVDSSHPLIRHDPALCIHCDRCVRICDELQAQHVWHVHFRGDARAIVADSGIALGDSSCVSCGACVDTCPSGALVDQHRWRSPSADRWVRTTCPYCGTGCELDAGMRGETLVDVRPAHDGLVSGGHLCVKGRYGFGFTHAQDRLVAPLLRVGEGWRRVSWQEAIGFIADRIDALKTVYGPDALGFLGSARAPNEDNYVLQKFARVVVGTNNVDSCARVCHTPSAAALKSMLGTGAATNSFADIDRAHTVMVVGANPTENHPIVGARIKRAKARGARLVVIDPRRTELAALADLHVRPRPGTDIAVLNAMAHVILRDGLTDTRFLETRVDETEAFASFVAPWTPERAEDVSGVSASVIVRAARLYAGRGPAFMCHGLGATEHQQGTETVMALVNLALLTGNLGRPGSGVNPLRGQNNVQGAAHMGCDPGVLPGGVSANEHRARMGLAWGHELPTSKGLHQLAMMDAARAGALKALYVMGYDIALSNPHAQSTAEALSRLELVVVQDLFMNETARRFAHVVLPAASSFERGGTFMNGERRIQPLSPCIRPPGDALPDWRILATLADSLGWRQSFEFDSVEHIWNEIRDVWPEARGISYQRLLREGGLQWPCPSADHPGTSILHTESFAHGPRASLKRIELRPAQEIQTPDFPLMMMTGRTLAAFNAHTMTSRSATRVLHETDTVEISAQDAASFGVDDAADTMIVSRYGRATVRARISHSVVPGQVFATFHDPRVMLNATTSPHRDRFVGTPAYKVTAVRLEHPR